MNNPSKNLPDVRQPKAPSHTKPALPIRRGVLVLGMHRSGTSAMTGVLGRLGCTLPTDLMGPGIGNEKGHWEAKGPVAVDDQILESAGSHWEDWAQFNLDWYNSPLYPAAVKKARAALRASFGQSPLFVLKDPRMCRLVPLWLDVFAAERIEPAIVLCLRHPADVARSLSSRDGMEYAYAHLLWLRYMLEAEAATRGTNRVICHFDQLRKDWQALTTRISEGLGIVWPRRSAQTQRDIEEFLGIPSSRPAGSPKLGAASKLIPWVVCADAILARWAEQGEDTADYPELDRILSELNAAAAVFAGLVLPGSKSMGPGGGHAMREAVSSMEDASREAAARVSACKEKIRELEILLGHATARADESESALVGRNQEVASLRGELEAANWLSRLKDAEVFAERSASELADRDRRITKLTLEGDRLRQIVAECRSMNELQASDQARVMADLGQRLTLAENICRRRDEQIAQISRERDEARMGARQLSAIRTKLGKARADVMEAAAERQSTQLELTRTRRSEYHLLDRLKVSGLKEGHMKQALTSAELRIAEMEDSLQRSTQIIDKERADRKQAEDAVSRAEARIAELTALFSKAEAALAQAKVERLAVERAAQLPPDETTERLKRQMQAVGVRHFSDGPNVEWFSRMADYVLKRPLWWMIMPAAWRRRHERVTLCRLGLFDTQAYLRHNPDVAARKADPLRHYLNHGMIEGRKLTR